MDSEAGFTVLEDPNGLFEPYSPSPQRFWTNPASAIDFENACNEFWWVSAYVVKGICRKQVIYATDHLYGICQQEFLKILAWQVASARGKVDIGKNYKYLHREAQRLAQKLGFDYDKEVAEKMIEYAEERVKKFGNN